MTNSIQLNEMATETQICKDSSSNTPKKVSVDIGHNADIMTSEYACMTEPKASEAAIGTIHNPLIISNYFSDK
jgi:hypothetical protein